MCMQRNCLTPFLIWGMGRYNHPWVRGLNIHRCKEKEIQRVKKNLGMHDICITNLCHRHTPCVPANRFNSTSYFV